MTGAYVFTGVCPFTFVGGYPIPGRGYPIPGLDGGGTPSQVWTGGVPHPWWEVPSSKICQDSMGYPRVQDWMGYHPPPNQETDQQREHLLCGGRCAFCVHAGGLSCFSCLHLCSWDNLTHAVIKLLQDVD